MPLRAMHHGKHGPAPTVRIMTRPAVLEDTAWHRDAVDTIAALAETGVILTADDLRKVMRPAPSDKAPGTAFRAARLLGIITTVGTRESTTPSRKGGLIRLWAAPTKEKS